MFQRSISAVFGVACQASQGLLRSGSVSVHGRSKIVLALSSASKPCHAMRITQTRCMATEKKQLVLLDINENGVATVRMNRPPVNSMNLELLEEMRSVLEALEKDKDVHGLILTSTLPTIFNAGVDLQELYPGTDRVRLERFWTTFQDVNLKLYTTPLVTIAAINGHAPAGGCVLSLCCDYRIMAPKATIGLNESLLGIIAPVWSIDMYMSIVGARQAEWTLQLGHIYSAEEAQKAGVVDRLSDDVMTEAHSEMNRWLKIEARARHMNKEYVRKEIREKFIANREQDVKGFLSIVTNDATQKALGEYFAKLSKKPSR